jgi:hypothetical protein
LRKANPSSRIVNPNIWSSILISETLTMSLTNSPVILPVPYLIEKIGILLLIKCLLKELLTWWSNPLCWRQPLVLHKELCTQRLEEPVSKMILNSCGGVPIDTTP